MSHYLKIVDFDQRAVHSEKPVRIRIGSELRVMEAGYAIAALRNHNAELSFAPKDLLRWQKVRDPEYMKRIGCAPWVRIKVHTGILTNEEYVLTLDQFIAHLAQCENTLKAPQAGQLPRAA